MIEFLVLGGLIAVGLALAAIFVFAWFLLKLVLWAVLLPIRLMFKLLMVPVWLTLGALGLAAGAVAVPVLLVAIAGVAIVGIVAAVLAVLLPVIPFVLLGLLLWAVFRSRPAVA